MLAPTGPARSNDEKSLAAFSAGSGQTEEAEYRETGGSRPETLNL